MERRQRGGPTPAENDPNPKKLGHYNQNLLRRSTHIEKKICFFSPYFRPGSPVDGIPGGGRLVGDREWTQIRPSGRAPPLPGPASKHSSLRRSTTGSKIENLLFLRGPFSRDQAPNRDPIVPEGIGWHTHP